MAMIWSHRLSQKSASTKALQLAALYNGPDEILGTSVNVRSQSSSTQSYGAEPHIVDKLGEVPPEIGERTKAIVSLRIPST